MKKLFSRLSLLTITLFAYGWRLHDLTRQSLWRDEVDAIYFALRPLHETLSMFTASAQNGALYFVSLRPWLQMAGSSEFSLRYISVMGGVLSTLLLWRVARVLLRPSDEPGAWSADTAALTAALLFACNPYQLWYSQEGKMYTLTTMLALLSTWFWLMGIWRRNIGRNWRNWLGYFVVTSLAMYTHLLMVLLIPLHFLWFWIAWPQSRRRWRGYFGALAGLTLPYVPFAWWHWAMLTSDQSMSSFTFTPLAQMARTLLLNHTRGFMPPGKLIWLSPIFFLGLAGLLMGVTELGGSQRATLYRGLPLWRLSNWRRFLLIVSWLILPIFFIYLISLRQPIFVDRYIIWVAPAAIMLLVLGLMVVWRNALFLSKPLTGLLLIYVLGFWLYAGWQQKNTEIKYDIRSAVAYVTAHRAPDELLILQIPHLEYSYRYYSSDQGAAPFEGSDARLGHWAQGLWTNNGAADAQARIEVDQQMRALVAGSTSLWVLTSEVEMWDRRHLMDEWLNEHAVLTDKAEFHGAQVRHYEVTRL
ncbi:MAG: glycosyltransferase family 39 protein [Caldilineaceae bacterium]|nr:glycosyltransferase family 39 protein [Caldilineaceae bacterium]